MSESEQPVTLKSTIRLCAVVFFVILCATSGMIATSFAHLGDRMSDDQLGQWLLRANLESLAARYRDPIDETEIKNSVVSFDGKTWLKISGVRDAIKAFEDQYADKLNI